MPQEPEPIIRRIALALGIGARHTVDAVQVPLRALSRLWHGGPAKRPHGKALLPAPRAPVEPLQRRPRRSRREPTPPATMAPRLDRLDAIERMDQEHAAALLAELLHDPDPGVRLAAAEAAGRAGSVGTVFSLILCLSDAVPEVRQQAKLAIERISDSQLELDLDAPESVRALQIDAIKAWWKQQRLHQLAQGEPDAP